MTYCSSELRQRGVDEFMVEWRKWRRSRGLTHVDVAMLIGVTADTICRNEIEVGRRPSDARTRRLRERLAKLQAEYTPGMRPRREERRGGWKKKGQSAHAS